MRLTTAIPLLVALGSLPAHAESWTLHSHKHWTVEAAITDGGDVQCTMTNFSPDNGIMFWLSMDQHGFDGNLYDRASSYREFTEGTIRITIDNRGGYTAPAIASDKTLWFDIPTGSTGASFLDDMWEGNRIRFDTDMDGQWDYWFSLAGSARAMLFFSDCIDKMK